MESFYLLVPAAMLLCGIAVGVFIWAVQRRQFDDLDNVGRQILFDDDPPVRRKVAGEDRNPPGRS